VAKASALVGIPAGPRTKWLVLVFWLILVAVAGPLSGKLMGNLIIPIILAVVFVILALLLRALIAPIMLILTVVLSFAAALGVSALFFDNVFNFGGADTSFPLFVFVFLAPLASITTSS
jgi:uncharacterized membrane protein YdfJ with MMPL/SSD domain